ATVVATRAVPPQTRSLSGARKREGPITERPRGPFSLILPAVFSATTLSALRVWNAPARPGRNAAMGLWAVAQAVTAARLAARPTGRRTHILAAMSSAGLAAAFAHEARKLDPGAARLAAPAGVGVRLANRAERSLDGPT